ncbi:MAG: hypothetical protein FJ288_15105 [Planctomycetes bacterium]|nr:hypothetical protein [Planctomycetota bacterium]
MIRMQDGSSGVAPPNREFIQPPAHAPGVAWRWLLRLAGQVRRQYLCRVRPDYVARIRQDRRGQCRLCGSCCDLTFHCPFLMPDCMCERYEKRMRTCRAFPIDAVDLRLTRVPCGHYYDSAPEDKARADSSG